MLEAKRKRVFEIIQVGYDEDIASRTFDISLMIMIVLNLLIAILMTFDAVEPYMDILRIVEFITVVLFTIEYALRLWTVDFLYPKLSHHRALIKYVTSFNGIIDMLAFFPYFLPFFFPSGAVAFRLIRVVRIFRLFRVNAYYDALNVIGEVVRGKKDQIWSSVFIIMILMMSSSLCMYSLEHEAQPDVFQNAFSGFWWSVSTLLTVGYGDIYPVTAAGQLVGIVITFLGVGMVAIPTGILSAGFVEQYTRMKSFKDYSLEADIRFVRLEVTENHPWLGLYVKDLQLPPGLLMAVIQRGGEVVVPRGDTLLHANDYVVLAAEGYQDEEGITLKELVLKDHHPWVGVMIKDLNISRQTLIVMVRRDGKLMIPRGGLRLEADDMMLLYTKKTYRGMHEVSI